MRNVNGTVLLAGWGSTGVIISPPWRWVNVPGLMSLMLVLRAQHFHFSLAYQTGMAEMEKG